MREGDAGLTKGEATRLFILEQAAPIFNRRGYTACSIQELMDATGLEKGGIYRHFLNKEELAVEAFRYALSKSVKTRTERLEGIPNAVDKLKRAVSVFVETPSVIDGGCVLMNTAIDSDDGNPRLRELALEALNGWQNRLAKIVIAGMRAGEIRSGVKPRQLANTIIATLEGALMMSRLQRTQSALRDAQTTLNGVLEGVRCPKSR
ncbi:TetR family transcriptional regulator [Granulicella sp. 5B5]|uniref:TetR/AcrR family transcriptional regulator n=1 Tax=Granulicella sp. 5B5 TaxID=1617967 RepID=UPI0015F6F4AE|nr:TetR/AcrR family transcriptional regulator [Granulicella sp. 5B5]QMV19948.1 TetR family transcriptional regulator [Granulicella sp. 5B5]